MNQSPTKRLNLSRSIMKFTKYEFALGLSRKTSSNQLDRIISILNRNGFKHLLVDDPKLTKNYLILLYYTKPKEFIKEAEKHFFLKKKMKDPIETKDSKRSLLKTLMIKKGSEHLDPRVKELECMERFTFAKRRLFLIDDANITNSSLSPQNLSPKPLSANSNPPKGFQLMEKAKSLWKGIFSSQSAKKEKQTESKRIPLKLSETVSSLSYKKTQNRAFSSPSKVDDFLKAPLSKSVDVLDEEENFRDYLKIFTSNEICRIFWFLLSSVEIDTADQDVIDTFNLKKKPQYRFISKRLIDFLKALQLLRFANPLHTEDVTHITTVDAITDYFGPKVSIYFEFMIFYMKWLIVPALSGVLLQHFGPESDPSLRVWLEVVYCLMIMVWATLFIRFWERKTKELSVRWGTFGSQFRIANTRHDFKGELRVNPITELPELYYPKRKKIPLYLASILMHTPLFLLSLVISVLFLNMKGNVMPEHWIYIETLSNLSKPGAWFHRASGLRSVLTIVEMFIKIGISSINKMLSIKTTDMENHRTHYSYNNALIAKRFMFGIFNKFLYLIYLAFWMLNIRALRRELIALYTFDEVKRLVKESIIPYVMKKLKAKNKKHSHKDKKGEDKHDIPQKQTIQDYVIEKGNELNEPDYNSFEDYYEMIMQFGYITLFAAAFPLSGALSFVLNIIEIYSDYFKLKHTVRRPLPEAVNGIGSWLTPLKVMSLLCVITNSILIAFKVEFRTAMSERINRHAVEEADGDMFGIIFMVEHLMLLLIFALRMLIKEQPSWVRIYVKRNLGTNTGLWEK